ncbi:MAG TPA: hypothetical protein VMV69_22305 [Pirellulales bacterium]|nr:hypothetical protein [Pirellulales bacterium]
MQPLTNMPDRHIYIEFATKTSNPNFPPCVGLGGACREVMCRAIGGFLAALRQVPEQDRMSSAALWKDMAHAVFNLKEFIYIQ